MDALTPDQIVSARQRWDLLAADLPLKRRGRELSGLCPFHAEKSPSFYVCPDKGFFHCFGCGAHGTAIDYFMRSRGFQFVDAVREILGLPEQLPRQSAPPRPREIDDRDGHREEIDKILSGCTPVTNTTPAHLYLWSRGLPTRQPALLAHPGLFYTEDADGPGREEPPWRRWQVEDGSWLRGRKFPALVAPMTDSSDHVSALLRIFVSDRMEGDAIDARAPVATRKKGIGVMRDGAIRLTPIEDVLHTLGLAEGVETGCAARQLHRTPTWAAGGTARFGFPAHWRERRTAPGDQPKLWFPPDRPPRDIETSWLEERPPSIWVPEWIEHLTIFGDRGSTGEIVASFAASYWRRQGIDAEAVFPDEGFGDFNDQVMGRRHA